jgi:hypothetical protein
LGGVTVEQLQRHHAPVICLTGKPCLRFRLSGL